MGSDCFIFYFVFDIVPMKPHLLLSLWLWPLVILKNDENWKGKCIFKTKFPAPSHSEIHRSHFA